MFVCLLKKKKTNLFWLLVLGLFNKQAKSDKKKKLFMNWLVNNRAQ